MRVVLAFDSHFFSSAGFITGVPMCNKPTHFPPRP
jgi:hypothetical protein